MYFFVFCGVSIKNINRFLSFLLLILCGYGCAAVHPTCDQPVSLAQSWAIATYRLLDEYNHQHCFCLGGDDLASPKNTKALLTEWWGITDRKSALDILDWLLKEGHRAKFEALRLKIDSMSPSDYQQAFALLPDDPLVKEKVTVVRLEGEKLGERGILAWDLSRFIWVASRSFAAGYLTKEEAWEKIMPVACQLQQSFSSWDEMGENYIIGRKFWAKGEKGSNEKLEAIKINLLRSENKASPWVSLPWNTPLDCK